MVPFNKYVVYSTISSFCLSASYTLASHAMLDTIQMAGVVNTLTLQYLGKDLVGELSMIAMVKPLSKIIDRHVPLLFTGIQTTALVIECNIGSLPINYFFPILSITCVMHSIAYTGTGAMQTKYLTRDPLNISARYTKVSATSSLGSSLGTGMTLGYLYLLDGSAGIWIAGFLGVNLLIRNIVYMKMFSKKNWDK